MADQGSLGLGVGSGAPQLFIEAQNRWLRPVEICEILRNYQKFQISSEAPTLPPSGSLFLFDRKVLRYFRKDGHNWRKKKDGKTINEAHEKLKVGSIDVLHCYYAHGEDNRNFQRRSYWMLEEELTHIVFVHYLEVKGNKTTNSPSNSYSTNTNIEPSGNTDLTSATSPQSSLYEDADSVYSHQASLQYHSILKLHQSPTSPLVNNVNKGINSSHFLYPGADSYQGHSSTHEVNPATATHGDDTNKNSSGAKDSQSLQSWEDVFEQCTRGYSNIPSNVPTSSDQPGNMSIEGILEILGSGGASTEKLNGSISIQSDWQIPFQNDALYVPDGFIEPTLDLDLLYDQIKNGGNAPNSSVSLYTDVVQPNNELVQNNLPILLPDEAGLIMSDKSVDNNNVFSILKKQLYLDGEEGLKKVDSFSRWVSKELVEVDDLNMRSSSSLSWSNAECENVVGDSSMSPSLARDQLFSIIDFSPKWASSNSKTEIHIIGTFLKNQQEAEKCKWSCMFGEVEVTAEVLADGILCCYAPPHTVARVPFYITCSNRLACSEVREFDFLEGSVYDIDVANLYGGNTDELQLHLQLESLLSFRSSSPDHPFDGDTEKQKVVSDILLLKEEDDFQMPEPTPGKDFSEETNWRLLMSSLKEKLHSWLLHRVIDGGKGPSVLNNDGEGMIHLVASLAYDWAIKPILIAGVSINFRDANGWTALHWAAFYGREKTVAVLLSYGALPGALTDPSPEFPLGQTPADLASARGHKGISGFLAESSLTTYLQSLTVNDPKEDGALEDSESKAVQTISEWTATPETGSEMPDVLSMKDSLTAIRNATQVASRIHQVFRMQSFQRKQFSESDTSGEHALSLITAKVQRLTYADAVAHSAAVQIQKKYRGWKKRKEFLIIRERIVKIQAHVRGHQMRKKYKTITWSVGILEKVILRWRRKGSGLRGFRREALANDSVQQSTPQEEEDDYDFLKEGKKQNEERVQKALSRVKSMFNNPDGRAQYRRLLTVVEGIRQNQTTDMVLGDPNEESNSDNNDLINLDMLLDDDTFMSIAFE